MSSLQIAAKLNHMPKDLGVNFYSILLIVPTQYSSLYNAYLFNIVSLLDCCFLVMFCDTQLVVYGSVIWVCNMGEFRVNIRS
jgi:hypothetical protein